MNLTATQKKIAAANKKWAERKTVPYAQKKKKHYNFKSYEHAHFSELESAFSDYISAGGTLKGLYQE